MGITGVYFLFVDTGGTVNPKNVSYPQLKVGPGKRKNIALPEDSGSASVPNLSTSTK